MTSHLHHAPFSASNNLDLAPLMERFLDIIPSQISAPLRRYTHDINGVSTSKTRNFGLDRRRLGFRQIFSLVNIIIVLWIIFLHWGERRVFHQSMEECDWASWEGWPRGSTPHRLAFVADPQLVDPHTYPGRPWPLSTLTVKYTDLYLRRSFSLMQQHLHPDTVMFLGDLFDGGREWATYTSSSPEDRYKKYNQDFWLREYARFGRIFFDHFADGGMEPNPGQPGRKIISSLPGNHDLGLGVGIQLPVRNRYNAYFGDGNRIDIIGNHSFVSVDTVSLSALGQVDPNTGSQGAGIGDTPVENEEIWRPSKDFLETAEGEKRRAISRELSIQNGLSESLHSPVVIPWNSPPEHHPSKPVGAADFPTVLLTHVPLYRPPGTPCGPLREHWPPTSHDPKEPIEYDEVNAIPVRAGYQYQNVLTPEISTMLIKSIGNVARVFSGDDHDYCEVVHRGYTSSSSEPSISSFQGGGIKEITVKSFSWAMGVRHPGFVLLSLWNPVSSTGESLTAGAPTMQTQLCLLPDQLGIFIRYGLLAGLTFITLLLRAIVVTVSPKKDSNRDPDTPILPLSVAHGKSKEDDSAACVSNSTTAGGSGDPRGLGLSVRTSATRTRSLSPGGGYGIPGSQPMFAENGDSGYFTRPKSMGKDKMEFMLDSGNYSNAASRSKGGMLSTGGNVLKELLSSLRRVGLFAGVWYLWLIWC